MRTYVKAFLRVQITIQSRIINRAITRIRNRGTVYLLQKPTPTQSEPTTTRRNGRRRDLLPPTFHALTFFPFSFIRPWPGFVRRFWWINGCRPSQVLWTYLEAVPDDDDPISVIRSRQDCCGCCGRQQDPRLLRWASPWGLWWLVAIKSHKCFIAKIRPPWPLHRS